MTREEAEHRARQLQAEHPERSTHRFVARESADGEWEVVTVPLPGRLERQDLKPTVAAEPTPSPADDPRTGHEQRIPGPPGGGI